MTSNPGLTSPCRVFFRQLVPEEECLRVAHLERLRPEDRRSRFMAEIDIREADEDHRLPRPSLTVGAFADDRLVGIAEIYVAGEAATPAEVAVTVEAPYQGRGIGTELIERALVLARNRGIRRVVSHCLDTNLRMQRIASRAGARLGHDTGDATATLELAAANPATLALEQIDTALAHVSRVLAALRPRPRPPARDPSGGRRPALSAA